MASVTWAISCRGWTSLQPASLSAARFIDRGMVASSVGENQDDFYWPLVGVRLVVWKYYELSDGGKN